MRSHLLRSFFYARAFAFDRSPAEANRWGRVGFVNRRREICDVMDHVQV